VKSLLIQYIEEHQLEDESDRSRILLSTTHELTRCLDMHAIHKEITPTPVLPVEELPSIDVKAEASYESSLDIVGGIWIPSASTLSSGWGVAKGEVWKAVELTNSTSSTCSTSKEIIMQQPKQQQQPAVVEPTVLSVRKDVIWKNLLHKLGNYHAIISNGTTNISNIIITAL
jgi:hypothetical protein